MSAAGIFRRSLFLGRVNPRYANAIPRARLSRSLIQSAAHSRNKGKFSGLTVSLVTLAATCAAYGTYNVFENDAHLLDSQDSTVCVDGAVTPFATTLGPPELPLSTKYVMLGYGIRSVTFVSFRVYALGVYIAEQDKHLIPDVLNSKFLSTAFIDTNSEKPHQENVKDAMEDPDKSSILIGNLLDSGARMLVKLTPVRNTDFNHLRDGFIRTILNHPEAKKNQELLTPGLDELKKAFTLNGKVAKDDDLIVELQANGSLQLSYYDRKKDKVVSMGQVDQPLVGKYLFSQYMSGPKPLSPSAKASVASHIAALV